MSRLEDNGVLTDCSLKTQESDETLDFNFNSANVVNKIIIKVKTTIVIIKVKSDYDYHQGKKNDDNDAAHDWSRLRMLSMNVGGGDGVCGQRGDDMKAGDDDYD